MANTEEITAKTIITTKTCTRCNGTKEYSFNLRDGKVCYGCGGTGVMAMAPKGQKKIKPTCTAHHKAVVGDIIESGCVLYEITEITMRNPQARDYDRYNQCMQVVRLVDGKVLYIKRISFQKIDEKKAE